MPNTQQAKKRLRQNVVRQERNRVVKTRFRNALRKFREAIEANNVEEAKQHSVAATRLLDRAAAKGIIHKNKAARLKSRMCSRIVKSAA